MGRHIDIQRKEEYMQQSKTVKEMVRCEQGDKIYLIPVDVFARAVLNIDIEGKKYVRYKTGAVLYDMSERQFMDIAKDAKATFKIGHMVLVKLDLVDAYIDCFHED